MCERSPEYLRPGGRFVLIAETYKDERFGRLLAIPMTMLRARYLTSSEHRALLTAAGFVDVSLDEDCGKGWMCALGRKPTAAAAEPVLQPTAAGAIISHTG